jgi:uncharacterized protein (TIGR04255 family)
MSTTFHNPPVVEVLLAVQFEPSSVTSAIAGAFWWDCLGIGDWNPPNEAGRLAETVERFAGDHSIRMPKFQVSFQNKTVMNRIQIRHRESPCMIQIQDTHFIYNWIKAGDQYPRFDTVKEEFDRYYEEFCNFLTNKCNFEPIKPNLWEVTYVNQIPRGNLWNTADEWPNVIPTLFGNTSSYGGTTLETLSGEWRSEIPDQRGRLHVRARQKTIEETQEPSLLLELQSRGPLPPEADLSEAFEIGHKCIINSFADITSKQAHQEWEREI